MQKPPEIGSTVWYDGKPFVVTSVVPILTPFRREGQTTRIEGWQLGLRAAQLLEVIP